MGRQLVGQDPTNWDLRMEGWGIGWKTDFKIIFSSSLLGIHCIAQFFPTAFSVLLPAANGCRVYCEQQKLSKPTLSSVASA